MALAPGLIADIALSPPMPEGRARAAAALRLTPVLKCAAAYDAPFWRRRGLSGEVYQTRGAIRAVVDHSAPDGGQPALLIFVVGDAARALSARPDDERRAIVLDELAALLGDDAAHPVAWAAKDWLSDRWSPGCVAITAAGRPVPTPAILAQPLGRVHLAGTETARRWPNYMDGAIEAGERAAAEILDRLAHRPQS
ncbi:MAG: FAD-dependent oxidoreductase [Myxococcota bacterium]